MMTNLAESLREPFFKFKATFDCPQCEQLMNEPFTVSECGHTFCRACILQWIGTRCCCPICQTPARIKGCLRNASQCNLVQIIKNLEPMLIGKQTVKHSEDKENMKVKHINEQVSQPRFEFDVKQEKAADMSQITFQPILQSTEIEKEKYCEQEGPIQKNSMAQHRRRSEPIRRSKQGKQSGSERPCSRRQSARSSYQFARANDCDTQLENKRSKDVKRWSCAFCTFINDGYVRSCSICRKTRKVQTPTNVASDHPSTVLLLSGLNDEMKAQVEDLILNVQSFLPFFDLVDVFDESVTHLLTQVDENGLCSRTIKYSLALANGAKVVGVQWIEEIRKSRRMVDETPFLVQGDTVVGNLIKQNINLSVLERKNLFAGFSFYFWHNFDAIQDSLKTIVTLLGGQLVKQKPSWESLDLGRVVDSVERPLVDYIIVLCDVTKKAPKRLQKCQTVGKSWLLNCVSHAKIRNFGDDLFEYKLLH